MENPPEQEINTSAEPLLAMAEYQGMVMGKYVRRTETKLQKETQKLHQVQKKVNTLNQTNETLYCDVAQLKEQNAEKKMQNAEMEEKLAETKSKLEEIKTVYKPKNAKWCEEIMERKIVQLQTNIEEKVNEAKQLEKSIKQKDGENFKLQEKVKVLETNLKTQKELKLKAQKQASKWQQIGQTVVWEESNLV